jgi:YidC/Oxa1 family membrane protein insertase
MGAILKPLYYAVSWILVEFHSLLNVILGKDTPASNGHPAIYHHGSIKWVLSIILLTVTLRVLMIPLFVKQIKAQRAMTALSPHIKEIQKKHKDDRQKQSEEMMKLYKEHKTNPFSSCLPVLIQSPFFYALYRILYGVSKQKPYGFVKGDLLTSAHSANFFGANLSDTFVSHDATGRARIVGLIMIILMSLSQFITQRQLIVKGMPKLDTSNNMIAQQQKMMMYVFPFIFLLMGINVPIGVLVYWLTTNIWTFGQQMYVIKRNPTPGSPAYEELQKKRNNKNNPNQIIEGVVVEEVEEKKGQRVQPQNNKRAKKKKS